MRFVITAGPTREYIDAVRFLSNPSTGKMGFALARAAVARGHEVILIAGPVSLKTPKGVTRVDVVSAREMLREVRGALGYLPLSATVVIGCAAVADMRPAKTANRKLHKRELGDTLKLVKNPDILKSISNAKSRIYKVGFAAETNDVLKSAERKCAAKGLEFIVANDVTKKGAGFGTDTNIATLLFKDGRKLPLKQMTKLALARRIVRECESVCNRDAL